MVHSRKIRPGKCLLVKTFMVSALAFSALASQAQGGISKSFETFGVRSLSTVHAKDAEYLAALCFVEGTMIGSTQEVNLDVVWAHPDSDSDSDSDSDRNSDRNRDRDRVGAKLVALSLMDGVERVRQ